MQFKDILLKASENKCSDIHLVFGLPPKYRIHGVITDFAEPTMTDDDCVSIARELTGFDDKKLSSIKDYDFAKTVETIRIRINLFRQQDHLSVAVRLLSSSIPELDFLGLPPAVKLLSSKQRGIIIVTGETGSGKSTTLAAILNEINHKRNDHIITLEDPIEYLYTPDKCVINQREIGRDTESYTLGLRSALREDPDVILIGEMRDLDTIETALTAAETGHLVFATLHTNSAADTIDRIVDVFPGEKQKQIRMQLSLTLQAVLAQQLLPLRNGGGRIPACEMMMVTPAIRNLIREGKTPQIYNAISTSAAEGNITMDNFLIKLYKDKLISQETAINAAIDQEFVKTHLNMANR